MWHKIKAMADMDIGSEPLHPGSMFPGRNANAAKHANPDYTVCRAAGQCILRCALVNLLTEEKEYKETALAPGMVFAVDPRPTSETQTG